MTPLPKHLEEIKKAGEALRQKAMDDIGEHWRSGKIASQNYHLGFTDCFDLMLKDMESMAKALESVVGDEADLFGEDVEEALKIWR